MNSYRTKQQKAQAQIEKKAASWIWGLINDTCWGRKTPEGPRPMNVKQAILAAINGGTNAWLRRPTIKAIRTHFRNEATHYFTGRRNSKSNRDYRTLLMIDIDCHDSGSLAGALEFAQYLADTYFPGLYFEPSTNGNGVHGYLIVEKPNWAEENYNKVLGKLDRWLKQVLSTTSFDVETVEIKGRCPVVTWAEEESPRFEVTFTKDDYEPHFEDMRFAGMVKQTKATAIKCGTLAKMPRDIVKLYTNGTHETTANDLCLLINQPVPGHDPAASEEKEGSCSGKFIEISRIATYMPIAKEVLKDSAAVGGRVKAVVEDMAIALVILEYCSLNLNADGSMPHKRIKSIWESLYSNGAVARAWDDKRFAFIRNLLSDNGLIAWTDNTYGTGRATKWTLTKDFMEQLKEARESADADSLNTTEEHTHILGRNSLAVVKWLRCQMAANEGRIGPRPRQTGIITPLCLPSSDEVEAFMGFTAAAA